MARHVAAPRCARIMTAPSPLYNRDVPLMPDTRYSFGTAAAGGRIYVIGGTLILVRDELNGMTRVGRYQKTEECSGPKKLGTNSSVVTKTPQLPP
jgi:hypothetical protein